MRFILGVRDCVAFYHVTIAQGLGVLRAANRLAKQGAIMQPVSQPDHDPFDDLAFAVCDAAINYRIAFNERADLAQRRAELVAACDVLATAEHPDRAAERDPVPDDLTERVVNAVRDAFREHEQRTRYTYPSAVDIVDAYEPAQRDAEPQPEHDDDQPIAEYGGKPVCYCHRHHASLGVHTPECTRRAAADGQ